MSMTCHQKKINLFFNVHLNIDLMENLTIKYSTYHGKIEGPAYNPVTGEVVFKTPKDLATFKVRPLKSRMLKYAMSVRMPRGVMLVQKQHKTMIDKGVFVFSDNITNCDTGHMEFRIVNASDKNVEIRANQILSSFTLQLNLPNLSKLNMQSWESEVEMWEGEEDVCPLPQLHYGVDFAEPRVIVTDMTEAFTKGLDAGKFSQQEDEPNTEWGATGQADQDQKEGSANLEQVLNDLDPSSSGKQTPVEGSTAVDVFTMAGDDPELAAMLRGDDPETVEKEGEEGEEE